MNEMYKELKKYGHVRLNEPLKKHTTMQVGGPADLFISVSENEKLAELFNFLTGEGVSFFVIGGGSNILMPDERYEGVVVSVESRRMECLGESIVCDAGVYLASLVNAAAANSLSGLEWAAGIPGTVGGAVRGNAGAMGGDASQNIDEVIAWKDGEVVTLKRHECDFGYRTSGFKKNGGVILRVVFKLEKGEAGEIIRVMNDNIGKRLLKHPKWPSCGSFFQNIDLSDWPGDVTLLPEKYRERHMIPVGYLVEEAGLKGLKIGGAGIADEHGNFIVNFGGATQADILSVVETMKEKVYNKFGVELIPEVQIIK